MLALLLCTAGLMLILANLAYSLLRWTCHTLRERTPPQRLPLGIPLLASLLFVGGLSAIETAAPAWYGLAVLDTGGPLAWLLAWRWRRRHRQPNARPVTATRVAHP